jgi:hypothetical protein
MKTTHIKVERRERIEVCIRRAGNSFMVVAVGPCTISLVTSMKRATDKTLGADLSGLSSLLHQLDAAVFRAALFGIIRGYRRRRTIPECMEAHGGNTVLGRELLKDGIGSPA